MLMLDVNVLIGAFRKDDLRHAQLHTWLRDAISSGESVALTPAVAAGYVRIVTNPRIFPTPTTVDVALGHIDALFANDSVVSVAPGPQHWAVFAQLCREANATGALVSDADHAATAIEHGATWVTLDRDFARFPGLTWKVPG